MTDWETAKRFSYLFAGRQDAHFISRDKNGFAKYTRVTTRTFYDHLSGAIEIGTYPVTDHGFAKWGCIDIDEEDLEKARDVSAAWSHYGVPSWVERSRSKGYHVWVFGETFLPAWLLRKAGQWINYVSGVEAPEVNPKNAAPWRVANGLVNTVRTPYSGLAAPGRMVVLSERGRELSAKDWSNRAVGERARKEMLLPLAERWEKKTLAERSIEDTTYGGSSTRRFAPSAEKQAAAQILAGKRTVASGERDNQFWTMANYLREREVPYPEALVIIGRVWAEQLVDKYDFSLDDAKRKVDRAYGRRG